jgi:hypothetical protein
VPAVTNLHQLKEINDFGQNANSKEIISKHNCTFEEAGAKD